MVSGRWEGFLQEVLSYQSGDEGDMAHHECFEARAGLTSGWDSLGFCARVTLRVMSGKKAGIINVVRLQVRWLSLKWADISVFAECRGYDSMFAFRTITSAQIGRARVFWIWWWTLTRERQFPGLLPHQIFIMTVGLLQAAKTYHFHIKHKSSITSSFPEAVGVEGGGADKDQNRTEMMGRITVCCSSWW